MITTTSPRTTLPKHSAGWRVMRLLSDRGGKNTREHPATWGRHRLCTVTEAYASLEHRVRVARLAVTRKPRR